MSTFVIADAAVALRDIAAQLDEFTPELTVEAAVEFLSNEGEIEAIAEEFPGTVAYHLARHDPETLRDALREQDELATFDRDQVSRLLSDLNDYAQSVRDVARERLEDVCGELDGIASEIESLVQGVESELDV